MKYISTRNTTTCLSASEAILTGISPEGGLFVPESFPQVTGEFIRGLCGLSYAQRAKQVMALFLDDFSDETLQACVEGAYVGTFDEDRPAPVKKVADSYLLELWHGPTCAFKDMALQMLPRLVSAARENLDDERKAIVLVATSGDTGKAALEGFQDVAGTGIVVFYPEDGVSQIQKLQMATQRGENVRVQAVKGNFDDCQTVSSVCLPMQLSLRNSRRKRCISPVRTPLTGAGCCRRSSITSAPMPIFSLMGP